MGLAWGAGLASAGTVLVGAGVGVLMGALGLKVGDGTGVWVGGTAVGAINVTVTVDGDACSSFTP